MRSFFRSLPPISIWLKVVLGLVLVAVLGVIVGIFLNFTITRTDNSSLASQQTSLSEQSTPTPVEHSVYLPLISRFDQNISIDEWNEYEDAAVGFSIKYPNGWHQQENMDFQQPQAIYNAFEARVMFADYPPPFFDQAGYTAQGCRFDILVAPANNDTETLFKSGEFDHSIIGSTIAFEIPISINGLEGVRKIYNLNENPSQNNQEVVFLLGKTNLFAIYFWSEGNNINTCDTFFDLALQTFREISK